MIRNFVYPYLYGSFDSSFFSFFNYIEEVLNVNYNCGAKWEWYKNTSNFGFIYPLENICIISRKPVFIRMVDGILHSDNSPAVEYADGFSVYCLNGVRVNKELVKTKAEDIDPRILFKEQNAEIRREIVRKIGIERVCMKLGAKCIDKKGDYELLLLDLGDNRKRPYLKMINPSIKTYHLEGVEPSIKTIEKALNWRNGTSESPLVLT